MFKKILKYFIGKVIRTLKPSKFYWMPYRSLKPLSSKYGFDRGKPIDRFWIESFLSKNAKFIKGNCLEVTDNKYTLEFGGRKVEKSDVIDINKSNKKANIIADFRNLNGSIDDNTYDCVILTHVLGGIDDYDSVIKECKRILRPGGVLLVTSSCFSRIWDVEGSYWHFTIASAKYAFGKHFSKKNLKISSYGNVLTGQGFWVGMSQEELTQKELEYNDSHYQCIIGIVAVKNKL